jgi:PA14 domain
MEPHSPGRPARSVTRQAGWAVPLCVFVATLAACQRTAVPPVAPVARHEARAQDPRMASELQRAEDRANVCSAREAKAAGLTAEYFAQKNLAGQALLVRAEGPPDHAWPIAGEDVKSAVRSARWRGWVRPPFSGRFRFHTGMPGARISVSGQNLTGDDRTVELYAGRYHPIQVELRELPVPLPAAGLTAAASPALPPLKLSWTTPFGARPCAVLFPPSETVGSVAAAGAGSSRQCPVK